jgi:hypothetical protein
MLNASRNEVTYLKDVLPATYGIIFLGTPHRGSSVATLGKIAQEITRILCKSPNVSVLRDLEVSSQTLERVGRGFNQILVERPIEIHSFREDIPTTGIMVSSSCLRWTIKSHRITTGCRSVLIHDRARKGDRRNHPNRS